MRVDNRAVEIANLLPPGTVLHRVLDFGCAEGKITASLRQALSLPVDDPTAPKMQAHLHGCDVRDIAQGDADGFAFTVCVFSS